MQLDAYGDKNPHMFKDKPQVRHDCKAVAQSALPPAHSSWGHIW